MDNMLIGLATGVAVTLLLVGVVVFARAGSLGRASWGLTVAGRANIDPGFAAKVNELMGAPAQPAVSTAGSPKPPPKPSGAPVRLLAVLQAEARLIDFLLEDIATFPDAQVGQAVREIHRKAQAALKVSASATRANNRRSANRWTTRRASAGSPPKRGARPVMSR